MRHALRYTARQLGESPRHAAVCEVAGPPKAQRVTGRQAAASNAQAKGLAERRTQLQGCAGDPHWRETTPGGRPPKGQAPDVSCASAARGVNLSGKADSEGLQGDCGNTGA
jgi:hypothetical protein